MKSMDSTKTFVNYRLVKSLYLTLQWALILGSISIMIFGKMPYFWKITFSTLLFLGSWKFFKLQISQNEKLIKGYQEAKKIEREKMPYLKYLLHKNNKARFNMYIRSLQLRKKKH